MKTRTLNSAIALLAVALATFAGSAGTLLAQDSLRIIELSAPGQSAPVSIPAGHVFTLSLRAPGPKTADFDINAAVGVITYAAPISYVHKYIFGMGGDWFVGPASVALRGSVAGARMQLYTMKLPPGVKAGVLSAQASTHSVAIPNGALLTSLLGFTGYSASASLYFPIPHAHCLSIRSPSGAIFDVESAFLVAGTTAAERPRPVGAASLHNSTTPASLVVGGFYYADLDSVSPTADFVGPGTATFSLPPEGADSTPIAFYCYRITPANVIVADATPPVVKVTTPNSAGATTTLSAYVLKGEVTDNINPTSMRFRTQQPNSTTYGAWASVTLSGDLKTKGWARSIGLTSKGIWRIEIQALDGEKNVSTVQTVALTRQ